MISEHYEDDEAAPLLADGSQNHSIQVDGDIKSNPKPRGSQAKERFLRIWRWLRNHSRILALTALVLGGVIALVTFVARMVSNFL